MNNHSKVSILINSYNRLDDLKDTITKTKNVNYPNFEIVIVDNGSTDGSSAFLNNLNEKNITKVIIPVNKGPAFSHDVGMRACKGEYIITIDDDCYLQPDVIKHTVKIFNEYPNLSAIGYGFLNPNVFFDKKMYLHDYYNHNELLNINVNNSYEPIIATSGAAFRKNALEKINYYDLNWFFVEDWELSLKLIANKFNTIKISSLTAFHKSSPINRDFENRRYHHIQGSLWIMIKFYPFPIMILYLTRLFYRTLYFSLLYKRKDYLMAYFNALKKIKTIYKNRKVIPYSVLKKQKKTDSSIFS